jgi:tryptophan-rich sensory protein
MKVTLYRYCMLIAAGTLLALSIFYFVGSSGIADALEKSSMPDFYQRSVRGLWLTFASQSLLMALLYALVSWRPRSVSREVVVICGLLQLVAAVLIFSSAQRGTLAVMLLAFAALFVLIGSLLWPSDEEMNAARVKAATRVIAASTPAAGAPAPPPEDPAL